MRDAIDEGAAMAKGTVDRVAEQSGEMASNVRGYAEHVLDRTRHGYRQVADRAEEGFRQASALARENPGMTISAALGIGLAIGALIGLSVGSDRRWR